MITDESLDLLAMAPTGSGKTAVALCAILQAFRRGKKACYTSPIKALSNQKYRELMEEFGDVGLMTGDASSIYLTNEKSFDSAFSQRRSPFSQVPQSFSS